MADYVDSAELLIADVKKILERSLLQTGCSNEFEEDFDLDKAARSVVAAWAQVVNTIRKDDAHADPGQASNLTALIDDISDSKAQLIVGRSHVRADVASRDLLLSSLPAIVTEAAARTVEHGEAAGFIVELVGLVVGGVVSVWDKAYKLAPEEICIAYAAVGAGKKSTFPIVPGCKCDPITASDVLDNIPMIETPDKIAQEFHADGFMICKRDMGPIWGCPYVSDSNPSLLVCGLGGVPYSRETAFARVSEIMDRLAEDGLFTNPDDKCGDGQQVGEKRYEYQF